ncbi:BZ3500_MvSof-1268-A1-R1_Chr5-1g07614 [Microbotryum saponariae]|uniref:BZ3500_MvSof-1268-A1-R1_Chr5-1g07614 protein n=1 Tax=Microbotryum saponariae TaxID=289078 RepID=A0A2X0M8K4_9BASI|nr:BZ3500_MvSof-1268-A1-R1_Chr5-1g07614 [Microbotryum saponariae]SDA05485.1 BZ3501_MvSof-1269-A2-R1_Chr5-2g07438 [Microbotryum saponariae]
MNTASNIIGHYLGDAPTKTEHFSNPAADKQKFADPSGANMLALAWYGKNDVQMIECPKPKIVDATDAIVKVTGTTVCGSDLHLLHGAVPEMQKGDILGHEYMGIIEQVGASVQGLQPGDRVVASFNVTCGECYMCKRGLTSGCQQSNSSNLMNALYGNRIVGMLGYSHLTGGIAGKPLLDDLTSSSHVSDTNFDTRLQRIAGGQAEFVRQPFASANLFKIPESIPDESALFLSDVLPTSYHCCHDTGVKKGDIVAIWGLGPIGLFTAKWALLAGASRVIGVDNVKWRLEYAQQKLGDKFEQLNFDEHTDVSARLNELTKPGSHGLDHTRPAGVDVALECAAGEFAAKAFVEKVELAIGLATDGSAIINEMIKAVVPFGRIGITGIYAGFVNHINIGAVMQKGVRLIGNGQAPAPVYIQKIIDDYLLPGKIDPCDLIVSNRIKLEDTAKVYKALDDRKESFVKVFIETKFSNKPSPKAPQEVTEL